MNSSSLFKTLSSFLIFLTTISCFATPASPQQPIINELTVEQKRSLRLALLDQMLAKYQKQQVFAQMQEYINTKLSEKGEVASVPPDVLIKETLDKTRSVYEKIQPFIGNKFKRNYDPVKIETAIDKYAWLKGPCFLILGIRKKHKIALSYFYLPGNEYLKQEFLQDAVQYSYPEVLNISENQAWFDNMKEVMERLGYKYFNVAEYINHKNEVK